MWAVVLLVLAGLLGGISSMGLWAARQWVRTQSGEVSLFLAVAGLSAAAGEPGRAVIDGTVAVMNGGPLLVEVDGVAREAAVMFLRGSQRVLPHMTSWAAAHATFPCLESVAPASVTVDLSVRTADGRRRIVTVLLPITGSVWSEAIARVCLHQP